MNRQDMAAFDRLFKLIANAYPQQTLREGVHHAYWEILRKFSIEAVDIAVRQAILQSPMWIPSAPAIAAICPWAEGEVRRRRERESRISGDHRLSAPSGFHESEDDPPGVKRFLRYCREHGTPEENPEWWDGFHKTPGWRAVYAVVVEGLKHPSDELEGP